MPPPPSLAVLGGPLNGRRVVLDAAEATIGSDPGCRLVVDLPGVSPVQARVVAVPAGFVVQEGPGGSGVYVNDDRVFGRALLRDGDILWLGPPGGESSVMIRCLLGAPPAPAVAEEFVIDESLDQPPVEEFLVTDEEAPAPAFVVNPPTRGPSVSGVHESAASEVFFVEEVPVAPPPSVVTPQHRPQAAPPPPAPASRPRATQGPPPAPAPRAPAPPAAAGTAPPPPTRPAAPAAPVPAAPPPPSPAPDEDLFVVESPPGPAQAPPPGPTAAPAQRAAATRPAASVPRGSQPTPASPAAGPAPRPTPPPRPAVARPSPPPRPMARAAAPLRPERPRPARVARGGRPVLLLGAFALVAVGGAGGYVAWRSATAPSLLSVAPARLAPGQRATLSGSNFATNPRDNLVLFGTAPARVLEAAPTQLTVEVPDLAAAPGRDTPVAVTVQVGARRTAATQVQAYGAPRIHGLSPDVAMPGEEVALAGTGFAPGAQVRFGSAEAETIQQTPTSLRVRVPPLEAPPGTSLSVTVAVAADASNAMPFMLGHLPLVLSVQPSTAAPGDLVTLTGRGFAPRAADNTVAVAGAPALVASASADGIAFVVPRLPGETSEAAVEIRSAGRPAAATTAISVPPRPDPVEFRFVPEPFADAPGHDHALLASDLGPAFVLSASGGRTAAERAVEAQKRLAAAAVVLRASRDADLEARDLEGAALLGLAGKPDVVLEPTDDDARGYDEDWTRLGGKGGPATRARLALWWTAVARDLVLLLIRSERPRFAAELAPEGRILGDLHALARRGAGFGVPRKLLGELKPPQREALRLLGLRVPEKVKGPAASAAPAGAPGARPLVLDGLWAGVEIEGGRRKPVTVTFRGTGGSYAYESGVVLGMPLLEVRQPKKDAVRFAFAARGFVRYYDGTWDGRRLSGTISSDPSGKGDVGSFELLPRR